jgi:membrane protein implicated in regulation of membrane protease activity
VNKHLKKIGNELKSVVSSILEILKYPMLVATLFIQILWIFACLCLATAYGYWAIGLMFIGLSPVVFVILKEARRRYNLLPPSEVWETTSEQWSKSFAEYVEKVRRKSKRV